MRARKGCVLERAPIFLRLRLRDLFYSTSVFEWTDDEKWRTIYDSHPRESSARVNAEDSFEEGENLYDPYMNRGAYANRGLKDGANALESYLA